MEKRDGKECPLLFYPDKCTGCKICQIRCSIRELGEFNPNKAYIVINRDGNGRTSNIMLTDACTWCGYCARFCPYGALELKKKVKEVV